MPLSEDAFTAIVTAGCDACASPNVVVEAYVAQRLPLMGGELFGSASWGYKGEDLVRGTYRIACSGCDKELFASTSCPRCDAADAIDRALATGNDVPLPTGCMSCGSELVTATAFVPAIVAYEGKRAAKARTETAPEDPGFHFYRAECKQCQSVAERRTPCPLCGT